MYEEYIFSEKLSENIDNISEMCYNEKTKLIVR